MFQKETHKLNPPHTPASNGKKKAFKKPWITFKQAFF